MSRRPLLWSIANRYGLELKNVVVVEVVLVVVVEVVVVVVVALALLWVLMVVVAVLVVVNKPNITGSGRKRAIKMLCACF